MLNISKTLWWIFSIWSLTIYTLINIPFDFIAIGYYLKICLTIFLNIHLNMHVGVMYVLHKGPGSQLRQTRSIDHISETVHCTVKQTLWYIHWTIANQEVGSYLGKCAIEWNGPILGPSALHDQPAYDQYGSSWMNQNKTSIKFWASQIKLQNCHINCDFKWSLIIISSPIVQPKHWPKLQNGEGEVRFNITKMVAVIDWLIA